MSIKIGMIHYNFAGTIDDFLAYCSKTGFEYLELQAGSIAGDNLEKAAEELRRKVDNHNLKVTAFAVGNDFVVLDPEEIKNQVNRTERMANLANILGAKTLRMEGGSPKDTVPETQWVEAMANCLELCVGQFAARDQVKLAVDNHGVVTNDGDLMLELIQRVNSPWVGTCLDTMNYRWFGHELETVGRYYEILAPHVLHLHLKDGRGSRGNYQGEALGEGEIDLKKAVEYLKEAEYDGVWTCEYEGRENDGTGQTKSYNWMINHL